MPCTVTKVPVTLQKCPFVLQKCLKKDRNVPFPLALSLSLSLSINNVCEGWGRVDLRKHRVVQLAPYILSSEHTREIYSIRSMETIRLIARKRGVTQRPSLFQSLLHPQPPYFFLNVFLIALCPTWIFKTAQEEKRARVV